MIDQSSPNHWFADSKLEQWSRLAISACILIVGMASLVKGYELAFNDGYHELFRPDGYVTDELYISVALFAWFACLLARRLRLLSWAMVAVLAWWSFTTTHYYLRDLYYVLGQDGCLPCDEEMTELHLATTVFALACGCWLLIFRRPPAKRWVKISVFVFFWVILSVLVCANDG
jgi:hypothetical protein